MVIPACAEEGGLLSELRHQPEADRVAIERDGLFEARHPEMDVPHRAARRQSVKRLGTGVVELGQERADVERERRHSMSTSPSHSSRGRSQ